MEKQETKQQENICLFDWLSFTLKTDNPDDIVEILGLEHVSWEPKQRGARGYKSGIYYDAISILYDGREDMGVWCDMSGAGCRAFEDASVYTWPELFKSLEQHGCNVTRLDVAFDDHTGILDLQQLEEDVRAVEFVSKARKVGAEWSLDQQTGIEGRTVYIGSPSSKMIIRIYDKAAEREKPDEHWIRVEMQMRDARAWQYVLKSAGTAGEIFAGVLVNYVRFVDADPFDSNRWRWPMKKYWADLIAGASAIKLYSNPGREYNEKKTRQFVFQHAGNAIDACRQMYGEAGFWERLENRGTAPNPKYDGVVREYLADQAERQHQRLSLEQKMYVKNSQAELADQATAYAAQLQREANHAAVQDALLDNAEYLERQKILKEEVEQLKLPLK